MSTKISTLTEYVLTLRVINGHKEAISKSERRIFNLIWPHIVEYLTYTGHRDIAEGAIKNKSDSELVWYNEEQIVVKGSDGVSHWQYVVEVKYLFDAEYRETLKQKYLEAEAKKELVHREKSAKLKEDRRALHLKLKKEFEC